MDFRAVELERFLANNAAILRVKVVEAKGSTPRDIDAFMLVSEKVSIGTIGGGQLEFEAIKTAKKMLITKQSVQDLEIKLGVNNAQCCGGVVTLNFQILSEKQKTILHEITKKTEKNLPHIYLFGAGHVGRALANQLALLPYNVTITDTRPNALNELPPIINCKISAIPEAIVREANPNSSFVIFTHDHALDFLILSEVLNKKDAIYAGMIGSKTKRVKFEKYYKNEGGDIALLSQITCPIGGDTSGDKRPQIIAALTLGEIISTLQR